MQKYTWLREPPRQAQQPPEPPPVVQEFTVSAHAVRRYLERIVCDPGIIKMKDWTDDELFVFLIQRHDTEAVQALQREILPEELWPRLRSAGLYDIRDSHTIVVEEFNVVTVAPTYHFRHRPRTPFI